LDIKAETIPLSSNERDDLKMANEKLNKLRREEKLKWAPRAKVKYIHEGAIILNIFTYSLMGSIEKKEKFPA
jgi:hypothetical protein